MSAAPDLSLHTIMAKLVSFATEAGNQTEIDNCFDMLETHLRDRNMHVVSHRSDGIPSIVATSRQTLKPKILLQAHIDVVPAKPEQYALKEENGRYYGRGVYDMKFAAACYLKLAGDLQDEMEKYDFGIMLTADEEIGGENGVGFLLEQGYDTELCILPDGGDNWDVEEFCNGIWIMKLRSRGKTAHGSRPWEGDCAVNRLLDALSKIREIFGVMEPNRNTLVISQIEGGAAMNQVADYAEATLDMRFLHKDQYESLRKEVEAVIADYGLEAEDLAQVDPCITDLTQPHIAKFIEVAARIRGQQIGSTRSLGASDARYFLPKNIPVLLVRPDGGAPHSDNEWIDKASFEQFYEVLKAYISETTRTA